MSSGYAVLNILIIISNDITVLCSSHYSILSLDEFASLCDHSNFHHQTKDKDSDHDVTPQLDLSELWGKTVYYTKTTGRKQTNLQDN